MIRFKDIEHLTTNVLRLEGGVDILLSAEDKENFFNFEDNEVIISVWVEEQDLENAFITVTDVYGEDETPINAEERANILYFIREEGLRLA